MSDNLPMSDQANHSFGGSVPDTRRFSSYDVLLMPLFPCPDPRQLQIRFVQGNHVGNQRFEVLLNIYRDRYIVADMLGDENERRNIAREVMNTVTRTSNPNGRFFEHCGGCQWRQIDFDPQAIFMIQSALKVPPISPTGNFYTQFNQSSTMAQRNSELKTSHSMPLKQSSRTSQGNVALKTSYSMPLKSKPDEENDNKRPCHRPSAFTMLCTAAKNSHDLVVSPNHFDVICEADGMHIQQGGHVGNNRFKVMLDINMMNYTVSDPDGKLKIAQDIVKSIIDDASSQFLQKDTVTKMYKPMNRKIALNCVRNSLNAAMGVNQGLRATAIKRLIDQKQKKAVLNRIERRNSVESLGCDIPPPTTFTSLTRPSSSSTRSKQKKFSAHAA